MNTKVRKKGSSRERLPIKTTKAWAKAKNEQKKTVFDLMVATGRSEGTIRTALKGYADKEMVKQLDKALGIKPESAEAA